MSINRASIVPNSQIQAQKVAASKEPGNSASQVAGKQIDNKKVDSGLIQKLSNSSVESRENVLQDVKARYEAGLFQSREQAEATANSILDE